MTQQLLSWVFIPEKRWLLFIQKRAHRYLQLLFCNSRTPQTTQMRFPGGMGRRPAVHPYRGTRPPWYEWCCPPDSWNPNSQRWWGLVGGALGRCSSQEGHQCHQRGSREMLSPFRCVRTQPESTAAVTTKSASWEQDHCWHSVLDLQAPEWWRSKFLLLLSWMVCGIKNTIAGAPGWHSG